MEATKRSALSRSGDRSRRSFDTQDPLDDHALAHDVAAAAAELLVGLRGSSDLRGPALGEAGDRASHRLILELLRHARPLDYIVSEEAPAATERLARDRVWIIDPLDGTREYGEEGCADWAVHVALAVKGVPVACAVALPASGLVFGTRSPPALPPVDGPGMRIQVSRSRAPAIANEVARRLGAELVPMGSAGAKTIAVIQGRAHAYLHAGGQYEWDSCAPAGVAAASGLHVSRIDGSCCTYNRADLLMPDLLVCRKELAPSLLEAIREAAAVTT
jgi:3'(2'), 5'-bisphosphate nucleotidase